MNHFWQNSNIELNQIGYRTPLSQYQVSDLGYNRVAQRPRFESALRVLTKFVVDPFLCIPVVNNVIACRKKLKKNLKYGKDILRTFSLMYVQFCTYIAHPC